MINGKIPTYVINLETSVDRKLYMENLLSTFDFLDITFIKAIDGRTIPEQILSKLFDTSLAFQRYGRELSQAEIGCTLSHHKCYRKLLESKNNYAFIVEDDITLVQDFKKITEFIHLINIDTPRVLLFSGDYWYYKSYKIDERYSLKKVCDAVGTYAYAINATAAKLILERNERISFVADSWSLYKKQGVELRAIYPYMIDANIGPFVSTINQSYFGEIRRNMSLEMCFCAYRLALIKKLLFKLGKFVSKQRKI